MSPRRSALAITVLAGCNPIFGIDMPTTDDSIRADAPTSDAPDAPTCVIPEADEDLDCVADTVDNCPTVPNFDQAAEDDPDPVGDACDPSQATHAPTVFIGFNDPMLPVGWSRLGTFDYADGRASHADNTQASIGGPTTDVTTLQVETTLTSWDMADLGPSRFAWATATLMSGARVSCGLAVVGGQYRFAHQACMTATCVPTAFGNDPVVEPLLVRLQVGSTAYSCRVGDALATMDLPKPLGVPLGVSVDASMRASFSYLWVLRTPAPPDDPALSTPLR